MMMKILIQCFVTFALVNGWRFTSLQRPRTASPPLSMSLLNGGLPVPIISSTAPLPVRVAYQGEPGAYSEKAARELLGPRVLTLNFESFEDAFRAVVSREVDYTLVPIENSLGGSIHANYDNLLRFDLHIIAEHEFRVEHTLMALPGTTKSQIKKVMSHPQALAQCDNYLRNMGVAREATYDTAGSAKMIKDLNLTDCAAIASDLAAKTFGLEILDSNIEDSDNNFTRFILLGLKPVSAIIPPSMPAKTSIVFVLPNNPGALYKALACFSLRDIDFCKIESRPTSVQLLSFLQFQKKSMSAPLEKTSPSKKLQETMSSQDLPRFRYTFYLDFLASEYDDRTQYALMHLKEQSDYVRVLGSYPKGSQLIGPIKAELARLDRIPITTEYPSSPVSISKSNKPAPLRIGIIGFGKFGQFLARTFVKNHKVFATNKNDASGVAGEIGVEYFPSYDIASLAKVDCDVLLVAVSIISFEEVLSKIPRELLKGKLIVDVLSVKVHAREVMQAVLPADADILCTHPMFGPESGKFGWQGLPFLYDKVRIRDSERCDRFLSIWESERCKMIEMSCEQHDEYAANSQFITHLTGRILGQQNLAPTPIDTKGFQTVLNLVENTCKDSFDLFFGLYFYNTHASSQLQNIREALSRVERQLAAKEAYLLAKAEVSSDQRNMILEECRTLIRDVLSDRSALLAGSNSTSILNELVSTENNGTTPFAE